MVQARNGSLTAGSGTVPTLRGGATIQVLMLCHALPRLARKQFPPIYPSNASADVASGIGIGKRIIYDARRSLIHSDPPCEQRATKVPQHPSHSCSRRNFDLR